MERFRVVLSGHTLTGVDKGTAQEQLARLMNRDEPFAAQLLAGRATTVKSSVDAGTGERYRQALAAIGVDCRLEREVLDFDEQIAVTASSRAIAATAATNGPATTAAAPKEAVNVGKPAADYGLFLLVIPIATAMLAWFWISSMNLLQSPGATLDGIAVVTILATAIVAAMEASKVGMVSDRAKGIYSPLQWFFVITFLWIVGYPAYLYKRRHYGLTNYLLGGIVVAIVFAVTYAALAYAINTRIEEIQGQMQQFQRDVQNLRP